MVFWLAESELQNCSELRKEDLGKLLCDAALNPIEPVVSREKAPCQEVIHRATDEDFDLFKLDSCANKYTSGCRTIYNNGNVLCNSSGHRAFRCDKRMGNQLKDELSIFLQPGSRHIGAMAEKATELGQTLPISISIGVHPAIEVGSCFEPPTTPLGYNELSIAGAIRNTPVVLTPCVTINENASAMLNML